MSRWPLVVAILGAALVLAGCPTRAGGSCTPGIAGECPTGYLCPQAEVCTKRCALKTDCAVACDIDAGAGCGYGEDCLGGFCSTSLSFECIDEYCRAPCSGDACLPDAYGPTSRHQVTQ